MQILPKCIFCVLANQSLTCQFKALATTQNLAYTPKWTDK